MKVEQEVGKHAVTIRDFYRDNRTSAGGEDRQGQ